MGFFLHSILVLLIIVSISTDGNAQHERKIDSLHQLLSIAKPDTNRIKIIFKLCWEHLQNRGTLDSSKYYADLGLRLSQDLSFQKGIAQVHYYYGVIDRLQGNYDDGINNFKTFAAFHATRGDSLNVANALYHIGVIYNYQGDYEKSLSTYFRILNIYTYKKDVYMVATLLNSIGIIFKDMGNYPQAIEKYEEAYVIFDSMSRKVDMADCLHNLGNAYALQKNYTQALNYYEKSLKLDEALNNEWGIAYQLESIGTAYMEMKQFSTALEYQIRSLEIRERLKQKKELATSLNQVGVLYTRLGQHEKAVSYFNRSLELANEIKVKPGIRDAYLNLADVYANLNEYKKAFEYHKLYGEVNDSLFHEDMMKQINELGVRYESDKKQQQITLLSQEKELQQAEILHQKVVKNGIVTGSILVILFIAALFLNHRQKQKSKEIIANKNEEINRQRIVELEKNQKLYALDAMITGQDVERKRIAQDLHDGLGALLSTVQMHFSSIENEIKKLHEMDVYTKANTLLDEACQEVRKIAHNMMPGTLLKFGLVPALRDMCDKINITNQINVDFNAFNIEDQRMAEHIEMTIYRLVQEGLNNVVKHSKANKVTVQLLKDEEEMHLTIEDDGVGFVVKEAFEKKGMGMRNLDTRVKYLNGRLDIHSEPGKGTSIVIDIPLT